MVVWATWGIWEVSNCKKGWFSTLHIVGVNEDVDASSLRLWRFLCGDPIGWVSSAIFVTVALTRLPFRLYHSVLLKRQTALVSTGNGIHILPQTSTICCCGLFSWHSTLFGNAGKDGD